jgi:hypothetical protein
MSGYLMDAVVPDLLNKFQDRTRKRWQYYILKVNPRTKVLAPYHG